MAAVALGVHEAREKVRHIVLWPNTTIETSRRHSCPSTLLHNQRSFCLRPPQNSKNKLLSPGALSRARTSMHVVESRRSCHGGSA